LTRSREGLWMAQSFPLDECHVATIWGMAESFRLTNHTCHSRRVSAPFPAVACRTISRLSGYLSVNATSPAEGIAQTVACGGRHRHQWSYCGGLAGCCLRGGGFPEPGGGSTSDLPTDDGRQGMPPPAAPGLLAGRLSDPGGEGSRGWAMRCNRLVVHTGRGKSKGVISGSDRASAMRIGLSRLPDLKGRR
jgi:hypothetical protein